MKKILLFAALFSGAVNAATLSVSDNLELLVVDGKEVKSGRFSHAESVELSEGEHQVVVRFDGEVKRGSKTTIYTTRPYLFDVNMTSQDAEITLPRLTTESQAKAYFARDPQWTLETATGVTTLSAVELIGDGLGAYSDIPALVAEYNKKNGIIIENGTPVDLQKTVVEVDDKTGKVQITGDALTQLKLWYSKASQEEKKTFKIWMAEHDFS
ncbi:YccT family protein [Photobacterium leiognathi]|uniref:YccT family protein n=1 Tax=Photobacterium leiognathi TaxID=553611 RepID=UPI003DA06858